MTVTLPREKIVDFSNPFYHSGLGAAVAAKPGSNFYAIIEALTSRDFLGTIGLLLGLLLVVGFVAWLAERRANPRDFEPEPVRGLFSGFWWAAVTMTTVGYGDKAPITFLGRLLGVVWMFYALILSAIIVAQLSAAVTEHRISQRIVNVDQLARMSVGYVRDAASLDDLRAIGVRPTPYADVEAGFEALLAGEIDAFVHDEPILTWEAAKTPGVDMTPIRFAPQNYAIVLPEDSPHRENMNQAILTILGSQQWKGVLRSYLGSNG
jgi:ABC-type amino acid transport substrate-binding protein